MTETEAGNSKDLTSHVIYVLPPNVYSLNNKLTESDVACCTEHCQKEEQIKLPSTELFNPLTPALNPPPGHFSGRSAI